jgi:hypothetical protein
VYQAPKIRLHLQGGLDDAIGPSPLERHPEPSVLPIIFGESERGSPVSLLRSFYNAWKSGGDFFDLGPVPLTSSQVISHGILLGVHVPSVEGRHFTKCRLRIPNLEFWMNEKPTSIAVFPGMTGIRMDYTRPPTHAFQCDAISGEVRFESSFTPPSSPTNDWTIRHRTELVIEPSAPKSLAWFNRVIGQIEQLFGLLFGQAVQSTRILLWVTPEVADENGPATYIRPVPRMEQLLDPIDLRFRFDDVAEYIPQILNSWLGESTSVRHSIMLLFSTLREPGAFLESRFLPLVQAVEVFAHCSHPESVVPKSEYNQLRDLLLSHLPDDVSQALADGIRGALAFGNMPRLKLQVGRLIESLNPQTQELFCVNRDEFIRGIVDTRNYLTHYSNRYDRVLQGAQLHWATVKLKLLLDILLLKRIGLTETLIQQGFRTNHRFSGERTVWKEVSERGSPVNQDDDHDGEID